jgi:tight adherence protein B
VNYTAVNLARILVLKWLGVGLFGGGLLVTTLSLAGNKQGAAYRYWTRYVVYLERKLRLMFIFTSGTSIAVGQMVAVFGIIAMAMLIDLPVWYGFIAGVIAVPPAYIEQMRQKRVLAIEEQLDGFLMALGNALKSTPSLGDAFISVQRLLTPPFQQEIELAVKEMRVGSSLEQVLLFMAGRIGSRQVDSAFAAILIGRQIGGNLPKILETTATSLREMARLEGVVRSKTAEGKAQLWVLAVFPLVLILIFSWMSKGYFDPLTQGMAGYICIGVAVAFWVASIVTARNILNVDI